MLYVEAEQNNVAVCNDIVLAFAADESLFLCGSHASLLDQIIKGDDLGADEAALKVAEWILPAACGAFVPFVIVHARTSFGPAVR